MNGQITSPADLLAAEKHARHFWVGLVVGLLGLQIAGGMFAVYLAMADPSSAIVPNYHYSAVNWDTTRRARQLTEHLEWNISTTVGAQLSESDRRVVRVEICDSQGAPMRGLNITASLYHHARGSEIHAIRFIEVDPGVYSGTTSLTQPGLWQVTLQIEGDHGVAEDSRELRVTR